MQYRKGFSGNFKRKIKIRTFYEWRKIWIKGKIVLHFETNNIGLIKHLVRKCGLSSTSPIGAIC